MTKTRIFIGLGLLLMVSGALAACAGFDLGDVVQTRTPQTIQQQTGLPSQLSLNAAESEYRAWYQDVQRASSEWRTSIERGNEIRNLLSQVTLQTLDSIGPTLAGVPVLGPALPLATGLLGVFLGAGRMRKEKEASFNKGLEEGATAARGGVPPGRSP